MKKSIRDKLASELLDVIEERIRKDYDKWRQRHKILRKTKALRPPNPSRRPVKDV